MALTIQLGCWIWRLLCAFVGWNDLLPGAIGSMPWILGSIDLRPAYTKITTNKPIRYNINRGYSSHNFSSVKSHSLLRFPSPHYFWYCSWSPFQFDPHFTLSRGRPSNVILPAYRSNPSLPLLPTWYVSDSNKNCRPLWVSVSQPKHSVNYCSLPEAIGPGRPVIEMTSKGRPVQHNS